MLNCQKLYELMNEIGVKSIVDLAKRSRIPYTTLNYMKTGHDMQVSTLVELAKFFEVPVDCLINSSYEIVTYNNNKAIYTGTNNFYETIVTSMM